jgi:hypothetical protein
MTGIRHWALLNERSRAGHCSAGVAGSPHFSHDFVIELHCKQCSITRPLISLDFYAAMRDRRSEIGVA